MAVMTYYVKYKKVKGGYKDEGFPRVFKTATALRTYFSRTSSMKVKFIKI